MNMSCLIILKKILSYFPKKMLMELDSIGWNWMIPCLENPRWALPIEATTLLRFGRSTFPLRFRIVKRCHGASFLRAQRNFIRKTKRYKQTILGENPCPARMIRNTCGYTTSNVYDGCVWNWGIVSKGLSYTGEMMINHQILDTILGRGWELRNL